MYRQLSLDRFQWVLAVAAVLFATTIGCGDSAPADAEQVNVTIANLSDAARDPDSFASFFVDGSAPDESQRHRYREYFYELDPPDISGNSATAMVRITNATGEVLDEKEWHFLKIDTQWKLRAAPLP